ncbi:hypothetical protein [Kitasatospora sp. NPDC050543]|uniref:hypothetical protein n=1 Tax=Kitasatospora sp. NPDC050543 TaxID=3364054 RepID=UPI0037B8B1B4
MHACYARQASCPSYYADVLLDFRRFGGWGGGVRVAISQGLVIDSWLDDEELPLEYLTHLAEGVAEELAENHPEYHADTLVVVRAVKLHPTDSNIFAFKGVGRVAVRVAVERLRGEQA